MKKKEVILNSFSSEETGFRRSEETGFRRTEETGFRTENNYQNASTMHFNSIEYSQQEEPRTRRVRSGAASSRSSGSRRPRKRKRANIITRIKESAFFSNLTKKKKIMLLVVAVLVLALLIGSCKFLFMLGNPLIGGDIEEDIRKAQDAVKNDMVSVLLVGTDGGGYNTDTIMLAVLNCKKNEISLISIPRDTRVPNPYGGSGYAKINSVYAAKGMAGLISQVKDVTGMPVNFYAMLNFDGFREAIDVLGGVEFNVPQRMKYYDPVQNLNIDLYPGLQVLDGNKAEQLVRCRSIYAMADLTRTEVQRDFIKATIEQHATAANLTKLSDLYKTLSPYVKTSITLGDAIKYGASVSAVKSDRIYSYMLPGAAGSYGSQNISYFIYNADEVKKLAEEVGYGDTEVVRLPAPSKSTTTAEPAKTEETDDAEETETTTTSSSTSSSESSSESSDTTDEETTESSSESSDEEKTEESSDSSSDSTSSSGTTSENTGSSSDNAGIITGNPGNPNSGSTTPAPAPAPAPTPAPSTDSGSSGNGELQLLPSDMIPYTPGT